MSTASIQAGLLLVVFLSGFPAGADELLGSYYRGRLTDELGHPIEGPVDLEISIYEHPWGGACRPWDLAIISGAHPLICDGPPLYSELHPAVSTDPQGIFYLQLGRGTPLGDAYDSTLFHTAPLYLQLSVDGVELAPLHEIAPVSRALVAQSARRAPEPASRFEPCADGLTVADHQSGLLWEKKSGEVASTLPPPCESAATCPDPHDVNNLYALSERGTEANGTAFSLFLSQLNDPLSALASSAENGGRGGCFADHCDWRLPTLPELKTLYDTEAAGSCGASDCLLQAFRDAGGSPGAGGSSSENWYLSSSLEQRSSDLAVVGLCVNPHNAGNAQNDTTNPRMARAVRVGTCR